MSWNEIPRVKSIWRIAVMVQAVMGFTLGLYLYIWGPLFYEKFVQAVGSEQAMTFTTIIFGINMGLIAFLEVPMGAIGDAIGRKKTVCLSFIFRIAFFFFLGLIPFYSSIGWLFVICLLAVTAFSLSYTLFSGTFAAWCVDSLREADPNIGYEQLLSRSYTLKFLYQIIGGVSGAILYLAKLSHFGFLLAAVCCITALIYCLKEMHEDQANSYLNFKDVGLTVTLQRMGEIVGVAFQVFRKSSAILSVVLIFACYMFVLNTVEYLWPVYLRESVPIGLQKFYWPILISILTLSSTAGSHLLSLFTSRNSHSGSARKASNSTLVYWFIGGALLASLPVLFLSYSTHSGLDTFWTFVSAIIPVLFAFGIMAPSFETLVNNFIPSGNSEERATIMSFGSLLRSALIMILAVPSGGKDAASTTIGWAIPAGLLLLATAYGFFVLYRVVNQPLAEEHDIVTS